MGEGTQPTGGSRPSKQRVAILAAIIGVVGGAVIFFGIMYLYNRGVSREAPPVPGVGGNATSGGTASDPFKADTLTMETGVVEIVPLSPVHVKVKSGKAASVDVPEDSGLTATIENNGVTISATTDAKKGPHVVKVKDAKGKEATITVTLKKS